MTGGHRRFWSLDVLVRLALMIVCVLVAWSLLSRHWVPLNDQPRPDSQTYAISAYQLTHGNGYTTPVPAGPHSPLNPPRYPPGFSLVLSPFTLVGQFPGNAQFGSGVIVVLLVLTLAWAALELAGPLSAILAVVLVATAPFTSGSAQLVLSDAFAAALALAVFALLNRPGPWTIGVAGFLAGYGVLVRASGIVVLVALLIVLRGRDRLVALGAAVPAVLTLAAFQWVAFGRPWRTGYGYWLPGFKQFGLTYLGSHPTLSDGPLYPDRLHNLVATWTCHVVSCHGTPTRGLPNWLFYPMALAGTSWVFAPPLLSAVGIVVAIRWWRRPVAQFALLVSALTLVLYVPYWYQGIRFVATPVLMLVVLACAGLVRWVATSRLGRNLPADLVPFRPLPGELEPVPTTTTSSSATATGPLRRRGRGVAVERGLVRCRAP